MRHPKSSSNTNIQQSIGVRWASTPQELQAEELLRCCELSRQLDAPNLGPKPAAMVIKLTGYFVSLPNLLTSSHRVFMPQIPLSSSTTILSPCFCDVFEFSRTECSHCIKLIKYILNIPKYSAPFCISASSYLKLKGKRDDCNSTDSGSRNSSPKI